MLKSDNYSFYSYRGRVYEKMNRLKEAEQDYKRALSLKPNDPRLKQALIDVISKEAEQESKF